MQGENSHLGDIDILIDFNPDNESYDNYMAVCDILEQLFKDYKLKLPHEMVWVLTLVKDPKRSGLCLKSRQSTLSISGMRVGICSPWLKKASLGEQLFEDDTLKRAVVRSLEVIGEATKKIPADFKVKWKNVKWKDMAGMRDRLIHDYIGVKYSIVWDVIKIRFRTCINK